VNISTGMFDCEMDSYLFCEGKLPTDGSQIASDGKVSPTGGTYSITLPAYSFKVLSGTPASAEQTTDGQITDEQITDGQTETPTQDAPATEGGCKSLAAPVAAVAVATAAAVACKKKKDF
ncbi:MAG: hypothetical protein IKW24_00425, partial [Clostridia bacterium]|nr:hypothetical protein [Clostridia bacterium]